MTKKSAAPPPQQFSLAQKWREARPGWRAPTGQWFGVSDDGDLRVETGESVFTLDSAAAKRLAEWLSDTFVVNHDGTELEWVTESERALLRERRERRRRKTAPAKN